MRMSADTPGYKGVVPTRQELMPGTNKRGQAPVIGIRPRPLSFPNDTFAGFTDMYVRRRIFLKRQTIVYN